MEPSPRAHGRPFPFPPHAFLPAGGGMIDGLRRVETPEGVRLDLRPAGPLGRGLAWLLDLAIRAGLYLLLAMVLALLGGLGMGAFLLAVFALEWLYPVCFEALAAGQTPGKMVLGLRVVGEDGTPVGWSRAMVRSLLMAADFLPFAYASGLLCMLLQREGRRLGDLAAGTLVVYAPRAVPRGPLPTASAPWMPPLPLDLEEQRAVIAFAERAASFSPERTRELAGLLRPLTGLEGEEAVARLKGLAGLCAGGRP